MIYVGCEEDALTLPWLRLGFIPPEPCRLVWDQSPLHQVVEVILADHRVDPDALDLARRQAGSRRGSAPAGPLALHLRGRLLRVFQHRRLILPHGGRSSSSGGPATRRKREGWRDREKEKREWWRAEQRPGPRPFIRPSDEWLTSGPKQSKQIPQQSRA